MYPISHSFFKNNRSNKEKSSFATSHLCRFIRPLSNEQMEYAGDCLLNPHKKRREGQRVIPINPKTESVDLLADLTHFYQMNYVPKVTLRLDNYRTLDAPGITQDYYQHPLTVNQSGMTFLALNDQIYSLDLKLDNKLIVSGGQATATPVTSICSLEAKNIPSNNLVYVKNSCKLNVVDVNTQAVSWTKEASTIGRGVLQEKNTYEFFVGSDSSVVAGYDTRTRGKSFRVNANSQTICSLAYNYDYLLAAGCNLNTVLVYDIRKIGGNQPPLIKYNKHQAGVRALSFSPDRQLLASGGGTLCTTLNIWDAQTGITKASCKTDSQITAVHWLNNSQKYCLSSHGYAAPTMLNLWSYNERASNSLHIIGNSGPREVGDSRCIDFRVNPKLKVVTAVSQGETLRFFTLPERVRGGAPLTLQKGRGNELLHLMPVIR